MKDLIVDKVLEKYQYRSSIGAIKYGTYLHENNFDNYLKHLQEELMDGSLYIEKIINQEKEITELIKKHSNDQELGQAIREKFTK